MFAFALDFTVRGMLLIGMGIKELVKALMQSSLQSAGSILLMKVMRIPIFLS